MKHTRESIFYKENNRWEHKRFQANRRIEVDLNKDNLVNREMEFNSESQIKENKEKVQFSNDDLLHQNEGQKRKQNMDKKSRAWIEVTYSNLHYNIQQLQQIAPKDCKIMAVVKANAYGHGAIEISSYCNQMGIDCFAVATLQEGIQLRQNGIEGDILILGYTSPEYYKDIIQYELIQTIVDLEYAKKLNRYEQKLKVQIKIDTGMHRLGIDARNVRAIEEIFEYPYLDIEGIYSHLSTSDSLRELDVIFCYNQIKEFFHVVNQLKEKGENLKAIHLQATYGLLNYPELPCNCARIGIALYGVMSQLNDKVRSDITLKPVLSLKARVAAVREIECGEGVSYGRNFISDSQKKIAAVTIGYADGIPRSLSNTKQTVLIHGQYAKIIGKICMDQFMIDVTEIEEVKQGDIVTIIGTDCGKSISAEQIAYHCNTITNDLLSGLGERLERVYINKV